MIKKKQAMHLACFKLYLNERSRQLY